MFFVTRPWPMPSVIEEPSDASSPRLNQLYMAAPSGSATAMRIFLFLAFKNIATPARVPPVPIAQVKPSSLPPVCAQISGPVPAICASRLAVLSHWLAQNAPISFARRSDTCT